MVLKHEFTYEEAHPRAIANIGKGAATGLSGFLIGLVAGLIIAGLFVWLIFLR